MQIKSLFVLASLAVSSLAKVSFAEVQNDIHFGMTAAVKDLNRAVKSFNTVLGTRSQAMAIHNSAVVVNNVIANTTRDINGITSKFSDDEAHELFRQLQYLEPTFSKSLNGIATRRPAIELIRGIPALIKKDLGIMKKSCDDFMDAFIKRAPSSVLAEAHAMKIGVDATFSSLLMLYKE